MSKILKRLEIFDEVLPAFDAKPAMVRAKVWRDLKDLGAQVDQAKQEAAALVEEAKADALQIREQAFQEGHAEGCAQYVEALSRTRADHSAWLERAEPEAVELALKIAARVIGEVVHTEPAALRTIARNAALAARGRGDFEMSIHPDALEQVQGLAQALSTELGVNIHLQTDLNLGPADCVVHTSAGDIDARLESQLQAIRRVLLGAR